MKTGIVLSRLVVGFLLGIAFFTASIQAQTIHLITVGDYRGFGGEALEGIQKDIANITLFFQENVPARNLNIVKVDCNMATPNAILQAIRSLKMEQNDTVVFYYSGHAANEPNQGGHYFQLKDEKGKAVGLTRVEVRKSIQEGKPRLTVLLTDCCNVFSETPMSEVQQQSISRGAGPSDFSPVIKELFLKPSGVADLTSSKIEEYSFAIGYGSIATVVWINVFKEINERLQKDSSAKIAWRDLQETIRIQADEMFQKERKSGNIDSRFTQKTQTPYAYEYPSVPRLGIRVMTLNNTKYNGVQVTEVTEGAPGQAAGLQIGDIISSFNGIELVDETDYSRAVDESPQKAEIVYWRNDRENRVAVELRGEPESVSSETERRQGEGSAVLDPTYYASQNGGQNSQGGQNRQIEQNGPSNQQDSNMASNRQNGEEREGGQNNQSGQGGQSGQNTGQGQQNGRNRMTQNNSTDSADGMVFGVTMKGNRIEKVFEGTPADGIGLKAGDVILTINGNVIKTRKHFDTAVDSSPDVARLVVLKEGKKKETLDICLNRGGTGESDSEAGSAPRQDNERNRVETGESGSEAGSAPRQDNERNRVETRESDSESGSAPRQDNERNRVETGESDSEAGNNAGTATENASSSSEQGVQDSSESSNLVFGATVSGNRIEKVFAGTPAERAGLEVNDLILQFNDTVIKTEDDFGRAVDASGSMASLKIQNGRNGQEKEIEVRLNK